jgi:hypothetical protein
MAAKYLGRAMATSTEMIIITTNSSTIVKPRLLRILLVNPIIFSPPFRS